MTAAQKPIEERADDLANLIDEAEQLLALADVPQLIAQVGRQLHLDSEAVARREAVIREAQERVRVAEASLEAASRAGGPGVSKHDLGLALEQVRRQQQGAGRPDVRAYCMTVLRQAIGRAYQAAPEVEPARAAREAAARELDAARKALAALEGEPLPQARSGAELLRELRTKAERRAGSKAKRG